MKENQSNLWKLLRNGLCGSLIMSMVACGGGEEAETATVGEPTDVEESAGVMDNWDTERFSSSMTSSGRFNGWDENDDNMLDENEFYSGYFDTWDVNDDNVLDEDEWNNATSDFGMQNQNMTEWDTDGDSQINEDEFRTAVARNNYYSEWDVDGDGMINEREYSDGIFGLWDNDRDGTITNEDYDRRYNRYYGS